MNDKSYTAGSVSFISQPNDIGGANSLINTHTAISEPESRGEHPYYWSSAYVLELHGLAGALKHHFGGYKFNCAKAFVPELEAAVTVGCAISRNIGSLLKNEQEILDVVGWPYNIDSPHAVLEKGLDKLVNVPMGGEMVKVPIRKTIKHLEPLQVINAHDYLLSLEAAANGNFLVHISGTHDGDIAPVAALAHYVHLLVP